MRYRKLDEHSDYRFGNGRADFYINNPTAVAQAILTRLLLVRGEWFLDVTEGVPYRTDVYGFGTSGKRDQAIKSVILETQGVVKIDSFESLFDPATRRYSVSCTVTTQYGKTPFNASL